MYKIFVNLASENHIFAAGFRTNSKGTLIFSRFVCYVSSETVPKGTLYTWRGSTDANFGALSISYQTSTILIFLVRLVIKGGLYKIFGCFPAASIQGRLVIKGGLYP